MKRKPISHFWSIMEEELSWLLGNNLLYVLCITPSVICGFLFLTFHAYIFLAAAAVSFIFSGPSIIAIHKSTLDAAMEEPKMFRRRFFAVYGLFFRQGIILGCVLATALILVGLPVYFALSTNDSYLGIIVFACCASLMLWFSSSSQFLTELCNHKKLEWRSLLRETFRPGFMSVVFGLIKLGWVFLFLFVPAFAISCALVGIPTLIRFAMLYYLYNPGNVN